MGLSLRRSLELVIAELSIVKAGAAYVPLDENAPLGRQAFARNPQKEGREDDCRHRPRSCGP